MRLAKIQHRLKVQSNIFSILVIDLRKALPDSVIMAPSPNCFKSRLNSLWNFYPYKLNPWCYEPRLKPRDHYQNAPTEAVVQLCKLSK